MDTKNYSLEKHLEAICSSDSDYNVLLATWRLNKENLSLALSSVALQFPHYSMHDATHSIKILENIQRLLGRERIERLGATDTFLLLMTALTHDLGMYMTYKLLEQKWDMPEMHSLLEQYAESDDKQIAKAARLLIDHSRGLIKSEDGYRWALEIRNAVTLIVAHQMRRGHSDRSADYIEKDSLVNKLTHGFHFELLPNRYLSLMAKVAYLHGTDFDKVLTTLPHKANGFKGDFIHPRFIASMIRMGDLLDIDNNRFNLFTIATVKELPDSSQAHYDKHQAVKHLLISPEGIEADLDCPTEASFRVAREVFDWLESEVSNLSREWSVIAPHDLGGLPPVLHKEKINIYFRGKRTRPELLNLRFDISSQRTFEMLKGGAIYENPGRVFLREIVQNAEDATRLQIWKDLDLHLPFTLKEPDRTIRTRGDIKFSDDIPTDVYNKYPISLKVDYDDKEMAITVVCEDWGTGISEESLIRMTSQVGISRKGDKGYEKMVKDMPYFLKPTAAFGLGLQTVFYVADEFTVDTQYPGEPTRHIVFRTSTNGSYCSSSDDENPLVRDGMIVRHGTTVTIKIDSEHLGKLFELNTEETNEMFANPESIVYYIIEMVDAYAKRTFDSIVDIPISYHSPYTSLNPKKDEIELKFKKEDGDFKVYELGETYLIEEKKYGSKLRVNLTKDFVYRYMHVQYRGKLVSVISIGVNIIDNWDLYTSEADKMIAISRDRFLPQGKIWCKKILSELNSSIVRILYDVLLEEYNNSPDTFNKERYFWLYYMNWHLTNPITMDMSPLEDEEYEILIYNSEGEEVSAKLFNANTIVYFKGVPGDEKQLIDLFMQQNHVDLGDNVVFNAWAMIIPDRYLITEVGFINKDGYSIYSYSTSESPHLVKGIVGYSHMSLILGYEKYKEIVVQKEAPTLGYGMPEHADCWIYPLGKDPDYIKEKANYNRKNAEVFLREEGIQQYVPDYLVDLIQKYSVLKVLENRTPTKDEIYETYIRFILDYLYED